MEKFKTFVNKHCWILSFFVFSFVSIFAFAYVGKLHFYMEDWGNFYFQLLGGNRAWPISSVKYLLYPLFYLFSLNPPGYFIALLITYILLCLAVALFAYELTQNKLIAFFSGLILSCGWVGSDVFYVIERGVYILFYALLLLWLVIYIKYTKGNQKYSVLSYLLFLFLIFVFPYRAFILFPLILLTDYFIAKLNRKRLVIYLIPYLTAYVVFPRILSGSKGGGIIPSIFTDTRAYGLESNLNFLSGLGNMYFPSYFQEYLKLNPFVSSFIGLFIIGLLVGLIIFVKSLKRSKRILIYLFLYSLFSYFIFHIKEYELIHPSWSRYYLSSYTFSVIITSILIMKLFIEKNKFTNKIIGYSILIGITITNLIANNFSPLKIELIKRSGQLKYFISELKQEVPTIKGKSLFYFDIVSDPPTQALFNSFLASGIFPNEIVLATLYNQNVDNIKIAQDYNDFIAENSKGRYPNKYLFFYSQEKRLQNLTSLYFQASPLPTSYKINNINYTSKITTSDTGSEGINDLLEINLGNFPSYLPITVDVTMKAGAKTSDISSFPFTDGSVSKELQKSFKSLDFHNIQARRELLRYISDRNIFNKVMTVSSNGYEYPFETSNLIDSDTETGWIASKNDWRQHKTAWIEITFPKETSLSEIRWISNHKNNFPTSYQYQIPNKETGLWQTIYSSKNQAVKTGDYVVDKISPTIITKLRMVINETSGDFPAISEIELLNYSPNVDSLWANFLTKHPFAEINNRTEMFEVLNALKNSFVMTIYPISDKYLNIYRSSPVRANIKIDSLTHNYRFIIPPGGTNLSKILLEFPNIPLSASITTVTLRQLPL